MSIEGAIAAAYPQTPEDIAAATERQVTIAANLMQQDPSLPQMTAIIMAGDIVSAERATVMLLNGVDFDRALAHVGSYSRLEWAAGAQEAGHTTRDHLLDLLPDLWRGSDPDDTDVRWLQLWNAAWLRNGRRTITDGKDIPSHSKVSGPGGRKYLRIFRGQGADQRAGIAWTLDEGVARKFAGGAGVRVPGGVVKPVVYTATVHARNVMAYLTQRGESEVIVNPAALRTS